ncbi:MAG: LuxR C-terminal-related transcriptional regulator [Cyclobacteriaceae bacterium]
MKFRILPFVSFCMLFLTLSPIGLIAQDVDLDDENVIIEKDTYWYYYDSIMPDNEPWFSEWNENLGWKRGRAELGYGEDDEATVISYGDDENTKYITSYFRRSFEVVDPEAYIGYLLNMKVDDGAVVYLNGSETWRVNMPEGPIVAGTRSHIRTTGDAEGEVDVYVLESEQLKRGENVIAVEVHQRGPTTSDCSFWMELLGAVDVEQVHKILRNEGAKLDEKLNDLMAQLSLRDKELELKVKDQELELNRMYINIVVGIVVVLLLTTFAFWHSQSRRNKAIAKNNELLKNELIGKNRELINLSMEQLNKNRLIHDLESDLTHMGNDENSGQLVSQLKNKLSSYSIQDKEWENLQMHFENVHSDYFKRLREEFPSLSSSELRMCGFIRLQLTTKEIANMLYVEPKSVQTSRYRLKKKLNVPSDEDLTHFLSRYY